MTALKVALVNQSRSRSNVEKTPRFVQTLLSVALLSAVIMPVYALETMSEASMGDATGEGLAIFTQNFQFQMPSVAGDVSQSGVPAYGNNYGAGTAVFGTGPGAVTPGNYGSYIYLSPLGEVPANTNRAHVFIHGISLSANDNNDVIPNIGVRCITTVHNSAGAQTVNGSGCISAGSVVRPGPASAANRPHNTLFNANPNGGINLGNENDPLTIATYTSNTPSVPLSPVTGLPDTEGYGNVYGLNGDSLVSIPFLHLAAPSSALPASDPSNNLRFGMWLNILQEDMTNLTTQRLGGNNGLTASGTAGPALQIQAILDGFGINGTKLNIFPTDACSGCVSDPLSAFGFGKTQYANRLGFSGFLRLNSQPSGVLRLSVAGAQTSTTTNDYGRFDNHEGLYLQELNVNFPIGKIGSQPLIITSATLAILGVGAGGSVLGIELAQLPNAPNVYNSTYINYDPNCTVSGIFCTSTSTSPYAVAGATGLTPAAGNCSSGFGSATACPSSATHGNISIGNVYVNTNSTVRYTYITGTNTPNIRTSCPTGQACNPVYPGEADALFTNTGALAVQNNVTGVAFKAPTANGAAVNLGNVAVSGLLINNLKMTVGGL